MKIKGNIFRYAATVLTTALLAAYAMAAEPEGKSADFRFAYDVDFEMNFDNRELYKSRFSRSMTIFGARLTPSVGLAVRQKNGMSHKIMVGIDIMKDFGNSPFPAGIYFRLLRRDIRAPEQHVPAPRAYTLLQIGQKIRQNCNDNVCRNIPAQVHR